MSEGKGVGFAILFVNPLDAYERRGNVRLIAAEAEAEAIATMSDIDLLSHEKLSDNSIKAFYNHIFFKYIHKNAKIPGFINCQVAGRQTAQAYCRILSCYKSGYSLI